MTEDQKLLERLRKLGRRLYEAERELVTNSVLLALILVFIFSVGAIARPLGTEVAKLASTAAAPRTTTDSKPAPQPAKQPAETSGKPASGTNVPDPQPTGQPPADQREMEPKPTLPTLQNAQNLDPTLVQRFAAFRQFIYDNFGQVLSIKSGWRSYAEQVQLYNSLPPGYANPPGTSHHEKGQAIDYEPYTPTFNQYLGKFGLTLPYAPKEEWHVEIVEPH